MCVLGDKLPCCEITILDAMFDLGKCHLVKNYHCVRAGRNINTKQTWKKGPNEHGTIIKICMYIVYQ